MSQQSEVRCCDRLFIDRTTGVGMIPNDPKGDEPPGSFKTDEAQWKKKQRGFPYIHVSYVYSYFVCNQGNTYNTYCLLIHF